VKVWISGGSGFVGSQLRRSIRSFGLDRDLLDFGPPPTPPFLIPYDTGLAARATAAALDVELPSPADQLAGLAMTFEEVRA